VPIPSIRHGPRAKIALLRETVRHKAGQSTSGRSGQRLAPTYRLPTDRWRSVTIYLFSTMLDYSDAMGTRPDTPVRALRRRHDALLTIWLAFLDKLDNPVHPRAAECRQEQRLGRDTSTRGLSRIRAVNCSLLTHTAKRPRLVDRARQGVAPV
jgi:hypothetical protein